MRTVAACRCQRTPDSGVRESDTNWRTARSSDLAARWLESWSLNEPLEEKLYGLSHSNLDHRRSDGGCGNIGAEG